MSERRRTWLAAAGLILLAALGGGGYWVFVHDPEPVDAIAFLYPLPAIASENNAIHTIAGLAAPPGTGNFRGWGYRRILENRERVREGLTPLPLLGNYAGSRQISSLAGVDRRRLYCWLPDPVGASRNANCYSRAELDSILRDNRERLRRYESMFGLTALDNPGYYGIDLADLLVFSDLYRLQFWLRGERLGAAESSRVFDFFRFWENLAAAAAVDVNNRLMLLLHYRKASALLSALAERDPTILLRYRERHGRFDEPDADQAFLDRALRGEYQRLDRQLCLHRELEREGECLVTTRRFRGKLGEFLRRVHARRARADDCGAETERQAGRISRFDFWRSLLRDPGNITGNILLTTVADRGDLCRLLRDYRLELEANVWRNRYVDLARRTDAGAAPADPAWRYESPLTGNRIYRDAGTNRLRWTNPRFARERELPLAPPAAAQ